MMPSPRHNKNRSSRTAAAVRYASFAVAFALAAGIAVAFALPGNGGVPPRSVVAVTPTATATATPTATAVATTPAKLYYENEQRVDTPGSHTWPERLTEYRPNTFRAGDREFRLKSSARRVGIFWYQGQLRFAWTQPESLAAPHSIADLTFEVRAGDALSGDFPGSAAQPAISQGVHKGWRYYEQTLSTAYPSLNAAALGDGIAFTLRVFDTALGRVPLRYENEQEVDTPGSHTWPERLTEYRPNTFRAGDREFRLKSGARRVGIFWYQGQLRFAWTQPDTLTAPHSIAGLTFRIRLGDALSGDFHGSAAQPAISQGVHKGWRYYEQTLSTAYPSLNAAALGDGLTFTLRVFDTPPCWNGTAVASPASNLGLVAEALLEAKAVLIGDGAATLNWSGGLAIASWEGVGLTTDAPSRVKSLSLSGQSLAGSIPSALGRLDGLTFLNLARNSLKGTIPEELEDLTNLDTLNLGGNTRLTGCIPPSLRNVEDNDLGNLGLPNCAAPASAATPTAPSG